MRLAFLADGVARGAAVLVAVPPQRRALLDRHVDGLRDHLSFADMRDLGRNPGRITLPPPPGWADGLAYGPGRLVALRRFVRRHARATGLDRGRTHDVLLAVTEVATNSLRHGGGGGTLWVWTEPAADGSSGRAAGELVCELRDAGHIQDPLAGRYLPSDDFEHGRGLWLVHQLCDLVEMRSDRSGTTTRLHVRAAAS